MALKDFISKIEENLYEISKDYKPEMLVPARFYASPSMLEDIIKDKSLEQLANTATLKGILKYALAMPDIHEGYGAPIGSVFATDLAEGLISPGAVGYDINCGVKLLRSELFKTDLENHKEKLADLIFQTVPSGVGRGGYWRLSFKEMDEVLARGLDFLKQKGYADNEDLNYCESRGSLTSASSEAVSDLAKRRGLDQLGTIGAGNHFLEVQYVSEIYLREEASKLGLKKDQITVLIHSGSRGLGHQVATDYIKKFGFLASQYGISLVDRELAAVPFSAKEGETYFKAMQAAANFAWANRQLITHLLRECFFKIFGPRGTLKSVYDVAHNIAKIEEHEIDGLRKKVLVHRKGATRSFPVYHPELPPDYLEIGQPVLIPGSMGTSSYLLLGDKKGKEAFYSSCHGAGRLMSRHEALKKLEGNKILKELAEKGVVARIHSIKGLAEEAAEVYKDVDEVVEVVAQSGLAKKVAQFKPLIVIKG